MCLRYAYSVKIEAPPTELTIVFQSVTESCGTVCTVLSSVNFALFCSQCRPTFSFAHCALLCSDTAFFCVYVSMHICTCMYECMHIACMYICMYENMYVCM